MKIKAIAALAYLGLVVSMAGSVQAVAATANFVQNGDFTIVTGGTNGHLGTGGFNATGWTTTGYNFLFNSASEANTGSGLELWGPGSRGGGSANGFTNSPTGGNFVGLDGAYPVGNVKGISQTIGNSTTGFLTVGQTYLLTFYTAAAQQEGFSGITTDYFNVSLGTVSPSNPIQKTATVTNASHGFVPWTKQTMLFKADATSEVLTFLSTGTPNGTPPFALLDGVSLTVVPEPSSVAAMLIGVLGLGVILFKRFRRKNTAA